MKSSIPIKNIYYMLSYAYQILRTEEFKKISGEKFENTEDLFASILILGIKKILKDSLNKDYVERELLSSCLRGKVNINESIKTLSFVKRQLVCNFDEYSINSNLNRILKSTVKLLMQFEIHKTQKVELNKLMLFFKSVEYVDLTLVNWQMRFSRNQQTYEMLMGICYLIVHGLIQNPENGNLKLMDFRDSQLMSALYERFILEYYKKHFPEYKPASKFVDWQIDNSNTYLLPRMKTDVMLCNGNKYLIIDAKYYHNSVLNRYNHDTAISNHLYQIFAYVKNKDFELAKINHSVSGVLLYAKTNNMVQPKSDFVMSGNRISIDYLDLSCDFEKIKEQLNLLINRFL